VSRSVTKATAATVSVVAVNGTGLKTKSPAVAVTISPAA
jgi:hypothetical protein